MPEEEKKKQDLIDVGDGDEKGTEIELDKNNEPVKQEEVVNEKIEVEQVPAEDKTYENEVTHSIKEDRGQGDLTLLIEMLTKQKQFLQNKCRQAGSEINELKRDNILLSYDVATLTNRIQELEKNVKR